MTKPMLHATGNPAAKGEPPSDVPAWPAWYALFTAWTRPAETTRRTANTSLLGAYVIHVVATLVIIYLIAIINAGWRVFDGPGMPMALLYKARWAAEDMWKWLSEGYDGSHWPVLKLALEIELTTITVATLLSPFGAQRESIGDSLRHALGRTWMFTAVLIPYLPLAILIQNNVAPCIERWDGHAWTVCLELENEDFDECIETDPYMLWSKRFEMAMTGLWVGFTGLMVAMLHRALAAPRAAPAMSWAPACRRCGYDLSGTPEAGSCGECGRPVVASLGESADPGAPWEQRATIGGLRAFASTLKEGLLRPRLLAEHLRLRPICAGYLKFWLFSLLAAGLGPIPMGACYALFVGQYWPTLDDMREYQWLGISAAASLWLLTILAAFAAGLLMFRGGGRNVLAGVAQLAVYMGGWLVLGAWLCCGLALFHKQRAYALVRVPDFTREPDGGWFPICWLAVCVVVALAYVAAVSRAAAGLCYARR